MDWCTVKGEHDMNSNFLFSIDVVIGIEADSSNCTADYRPAGFSFV